MRLIGEVDCSSDDDLAEYNLDTYDESEKGSDEEQTSVFNNIQSLVYHQPDEADPYITMKVSTAQPADWARPPGLGAETAHWRPR